MRNLIVTDSLSMKKNKAGRGARRLLRVCSFFIGWADNACLIGWWVSQDLREVRAGNHTYLGRNGSRWGGWGELQEPGQRRSRGLVNVGPCRPWASKMLIPECFPASWLEVSLSGSVSLMHSNSKAKPTWNLSLWFLTRLSPQKQGLPCSLLHP